MKTCGTLLLLLSVVLVLTGCADQGNSSSGLPLQLERTFTLQESDELFIGDFRAVTVATDPFRMYIPDHVTGRVIVADSTGALIKRIGSFGQGPGEMTQPTHVEVLNDRLYVVDLDRFSVFDTSGTFQRTRQLPEGLYLTASLSLTNDGDFLYLGATDVHRRTAGLLASATDPAIARLDPDTFELEAHFGTYPEFYQTYEQTIRWRYLSTNQDNLLAAGFSHVPEVSLYDIADAEPRKVGEVAFRHPEFRQSETDMGLGMTLAEMRDVWTSTSIVFGTWLTDEGTLIHQFRNQQEAYFETRDPADMIYYASFAAIDGDTHRHVKLPGPILDVGADGRVYILRSPEADAREIGVYRVQLARG